MLRYSGAADCSTSSRVHHQRYVSEPSSSTSAAVQTNKTSCRHSKVAAVADTTNKTTKVSGRYQKNRPSSTLDRDIKTTTAASKTSLSSTLQQIGDWARRSFRGHGKGVAGRRPKSLNDYIMTEVSSGVVVERKSVELPPSAASRDQSPVTTSSGYASGDGVYSRLHEEDFDEGEGRHLGRQMQRGPSRGSRRYRRRASVHAGTGPLPPPLTPAEHVVKPPSTSASTSDNKHDEIRHPVYENLLSEALGRKCETNAEPMPVSQTQHHTRPARHMNTSHHDIPINHEVDPQLRPTKAEGVTDTGNVSINDYLLPREHSSFVSSSDASTLRRTGNKSSPVYVNGNLLMTSLNRSSSLRQNESVRRSRSRSLSSSRNKTLTDDQTTFNFGGVQQRLSFTPSFVSRSPSPPEPAAADADWDDRLSTLSLGCRRPPVSPDRHCIAQRPDAHQPRPKTARRRLLFGNYAMTLVDRRPEAVEESVRPLSRQTRPPSTITNVASLNLPASRSVGLFPLLGEDRQESIYETISDVIGESKHPVSRVHRKELEVSSEHVYHNIDDFLVSSAAVSTDIHQLPPPLPPPPLPARRPIAGREMPLCRSDVVELDSQHVYTIADVLDSFEALVSHLPRAHRFVYDLQMAAYLHRRRQATAEQPAEREHQADKDDQERWSAAAAMSRGPTSDQRAGRANEKSSTWCNGPAERQVRRATAKYSSKQSQPIEDYVCSPGNHLSSDRPRRSTSTDAATTANTSHDDGLYIPMKLGSKPPQSAIFCCSGRTGTFDGRRPNSLSSTANAERKQKQATNRTDKKQSHVPSTMSHSIAEMNRHDDVADRDNVGRGRRSSKFFQMPPSFMDTSSHMRTNSPFGGDIGRHHKVLSRSLMDGISHQQPRSTSGNFADRKQNCCMASSTFAVDNAMDRRSTVLGRSSDDLDARRPHCAPRSASEDRQTGSGNTSKVRSPRAVDDAYRNNNKSSHRSRAVDRNTSVLSRSLMTTSTVPQHSVTSSGVPPSSSMSFHELPPKCDRRRSSVLQWTAQSCSGREIFC